MRLGALLVLLYAYACAADDVEVYDEEPAADEEEPEVIDESIRRSVDALLRFPLQLDEIKHRITVSDGDKDTGFLELSGREEVADAAADWLKDGSFSSEDVDLCLGHMEKNDKVMIHDGEVHLI